MQELFVGIPYAPFSKFDQLGKAADWTMANRQGRTLDPSLEPSWSWASLMDSLCLI